VLLKAHQETFTGPDGPITVHLRQLHRDDEDKIEMFLKSLSSESMYHRFLTLGCSKKWLQEEFFDFNQDCDIAIVAVVMDGKEGKNEKIIGESRYFLNNGTNEAEFAVLVQDYYQRRGIGTFMLDYLVRTARKQGIDALYACVHRGNLVMCRFLEKSGRITKRFCSLEDDEFIFKLRL
jgi:acetyltransferase